MRYNRKKFQEFIMGVFPDGVLTSKTAGDEYRIPCPFCKGGQGREISFDVNLDQGVVRCWRASCNYSASAGWMVKELLGIDYPRALDIVSLGISDDEVFSSLLASNDEPILFNYAPDLNKIEAWSECFLKIENVEKYSDVFNWLENRGYDPYQFEIEHDLYYPSQFGKYKGRVVFRIETDSNYAYLAYSMDSEIKPKTMNPSGIKLTNLLYNYNNVLEGKVIFVCEGIFDSARLISYGFNAVSIFGSAMSDRQRSLLAKTNAEEIVICLDNGLFEKSIAFAEKLRNDARNKTISVINITKTGADPDDLTEEEILTYYKERTIVALSEEDILKSFLTRLD